MALLHIDGFDGQTSQRAGAYSPNCNYGYGSYTTGRFGTGSAMLGNSGTNAACEFRVTFPANKTVIYTGVAVKNGGGGTAHPGCLFDFVQGGATILSYRVWTTTSSSTVGRSWLTRGALNTAGTVVAISSIDMPNGWNFIEMKVVIGTGTNGSAIVRQNGVEVINVSGVDTGGSYATGLGLGQRRAYQDEVDGWANTVDDWWICDDTGTVNNNFLGDLRIVNLVPAGPGASTQLVPSTGQNWMCVDEVPLALADYVSSATPGDKDLYVKAPLAAGDANIRGALVKSSAFTSDAGGSKGRSICKSGATTGAGVDNTLSPTAYLYQDLYEKDPNTSALWTQANFNAAQFGWEVRP